MAISTENRARNESTETTYLTKRVLMRAEHKDELEMHEASASDYNGNIPERVVVVKRDQTYYGPRLRVEPLDADEQYILTIPGPKSEAILWHLTDAGWKEMVEVSLDFGESIPQYDICLYCNEPLSTVAHRRRAAVGACQRD